MKILLTGVSGFAASHLAARLLKFGHEVHGTIRVRSDLHRIADIRNQLKLHYVELTDPVCIRNLLEKEQFDQIYHLAAQSFVKTSWSAPLETFATNVDGTVAMFEAIRQLAKKPKVLVTSTSEVYGLVEGNINENTPPAPETPYGIAKYAQDMIARMYAKAYDLE